MIKFIIFLMKLFVAILVSILFSSCHFQANFDGIEGSGTVITQDRNITEEFKKIEVNQGIELVVEQSSTKSVQVKADDNIIGHIITKVENGTLIIETDHGYNTSNNPKVIVRLPIISELVASSGSKITSNNSLITEKIVVNSTSGSNIDIKVEADFISIESTSGSYAEVSGKALKLETSSSSGSEINARGLNTNVVYSDASSSSSTSVDAIVKLDAHASSGASIKYKSSPKELRKQESSGGSVSGY